MTTAGASIITNIMVRNQKYTHNINDLGNRLGLYMKPTVGQCSGYRSAVETFVSRCASHDAVVDNPREVATKLLGCR